MFHALRDSSRQALAVVSMVAVVTMSFAGLSLGIKEAQAADNTLVSIAYDDANDNGKIDSIQVTIDNDANHVYIIQDYAGWLVTDDGEEIDIDSITSPDLDADPLLIQISLDEADEDLTVDTANGDLEVSYTQQAVGTGTEYTGDPNIQLVAIATGDGSPELTEQDAAQPVILSVSPADAATNVLRTESIVVTFSEAMDTTWAHATQFTSTPDPSGWSYVWSAGDTVVTMSHSPYSASSDVNIALDDTEIDAAAGLQVDLLTSGPEDGDWDFRTRALGSSGGGTAYPGGTISKTYTVAVDNPNGGTFGYGETLPIRWTMGGDGTVSYVNVAYSLDGGSAWTELAHNMANTGEYLWTVPNVSTDNALVRVEATDLAIVMASDTNDTPLKFVGSEATPEVPDEQVDAPGSGKYGPSPVTGEVEEISVVNPGDYVVSPSFSTVYYVDANKVRHPFLNTATFFTWASSFNQVKIVTDATMPTLGYGDPIMPKPGVVLVKITSDPTVYAIDENPDNKYQPTLRRIVSEGTARSIYGDDWADYVIDIDVTMFSRFQFGADILSANDVEFDLDAMKKRWTLAKK